MNPLRGIGLKILSVAVFTAMAACIKAAAIADVPPGQAVFFRSLFAIPVILVWLVLQHDLAHGLSTRNPMGHLWRGLVGGAAMACGFTALGLLPLPEVTAIGYAAPLLIVIFAAMFLGEEVRLFRLTAVLLGLIGVVIVLSPRLSVTSIETASQWETLGAMTALMGAILAALAQVFIRKLVQVETTAAIVFYFSVTTTPVAVHHPLRLDLARSANGRTSCQRRHLRWPGADPADLQLPLRTHLRHRTFRVCLNADGHRDRLCGVLGGSDGPHAGRGRAGRRRGPLHHLARAATGARTGQGTACDDTAGLTRARPCRITPAC